MPSYIVKPKADEDFYVSYSTVVDSVVAYGTREQFLETEDPARIDRTDRLGSSALIGPPAYLGWAYSEVMVREGIVDATRPENSSRGYIQREDLRALCGTLQGDGEFHPPAEMIQWVTDDE